MNLPRLICTHILAGALAASALAAPSRLPSYGADPGKTSVSGLSSGAFMAMQLQVAYSGSIVGSGIVAGGPYYCAANQLLGFVEICMAGGLGFIPLDPSLMVGAARLFAGQELIDPLARLKSRRIYLFSGTDDDIVHQAAVDASVRFFRHAGVPKSNIKYVNKLPAGHALITPAFGNDCAANATPYISHCTVGSTGYDQAGGMLKHIYAALQPRVATPAGTFVAFEQAEFATSAAAMADTGHLYVPPGCAVAGTRCKVHVALHGCLQSVESVGDKFYKDTGYNNWADANNILVLYPQVNKSDVPFNPKGCWDWWGYTGSNYSRKSGPQMKAIDAMIARLVHPR